MSKADVISEIEGKYNLAQGCVMFVYIVGVMPWRETIKTFVGPAEVGINSLRNQCKITFTPSQLLQRYSNPNSVQDDGINIIRLGLTDAIRQSFETIREFCETSSQMTAFRSFAWYHFVRLIRNC